MGGTLDVYYPENSLLHSLDPRSKIIVFFALIFILVLSPLSYKFLAYFGLLLGFMLLSKVPLSVLLKRSAVVLPFAVVIGIFLPFLPRPGLLPNDYLQLGFFKMNRPGLMLFCSISLKSWLSALTMITLTATTKFPELLKGLEKLYVSRVMILIISFMYRYIFVFLEQVQNTRKTMLSRNFGGSKIWQWKILSSLIASIFIRTYEQSERIYVAMLSRGFTGDMPIWQEMSFGQRDYGFLLAAGIFLLVLSLR